MLIHHYYTKVMDLLQEINDVVRSNLNYEGALRANRRRPNTKF